jgi:hypothetical protein
MRPSFIRTIMLAAASMFGGHAAEVPPVSKVKMSSTYGKLPQTSSHRRSAPHQGRSYRRGWPKHLAPSRAWHVGRLREL